MIIICVGKLKNQELLKLIKEYEKRLDKPPKIIELKDSNKEKEGNSILDKLETIYDPFIISLDEHGFQKSSIEFANLIKKSEQELVFIIGGPDGLSENVLQKVDLILGISKMTFTHEMARYLLYEQIYRAQEINKGKKYHRE